MRSPSSKVKSLFFINNYGKWANDLRNAFFDDIVAVTESSHVLKTLSSSVGVHVKGPTHI